MRTLQCEAMPTRSRTPSVFLSYSHRDEAWKDRLKIHLRVLEQVDALVVWDDRRIDAGESWYDTLRVAMDNAQAAVCLISAHYLGSAFCVKEEVPYLLRRRAEEGMLLIPVLLLPCPWGQVPWLRSLQMLPSDGRSVAELVAVEQEAIFSYVAETVVHNVLARRKLVGKGAPSAPASASLEGVGTQIDISRLPVTGAELFGRQNEMNWLDGLWEEGRIRVAALVAWGGVGKSTLVNKWLEGLKARSWGGASRVYGWSFFSQGTGHRVTSADVFIDHALRWFGDRDPSAGSPWAKGERLAALIRTEKTLLVLDGIEPLQSSYATDSGTIKDSALAALLSELASPSAEQWGLCLITSREAVIDLREFTETYLQKDLEQISAEAGRALLRVGGVRGTDAELMRTSRAFGNQALAVKLLAAYLAGVPGRAVTSAQEIPDFHFADEEGRHPRRVMEAFARRFGTGPELELLGVLGLFDRPASTAALDAIRAEPVIPGLTEHLSVLTEGGWLRLLQRLRDLRLVAARDPHAADEINAHPLIRQHFCERLRERAPDAWREAHARLSVHYRQMAPDLPETAGEMVPLYAALTHACKAAQYEEGLHEIYRRRILRGSEEFSVYKLGMVGADLAALASFFPAGWHQPEPSLSRADRIFLMERAGLYLRTLGRLEAVDVLHAALDLARESQEQVLAEKCLRHLAAAYRTAGELQRSLECTQEAITRADLRRELFYRVANRASLGQVLHYLGHWDPAHSAFEEAESLQAGSNPDFPWLSSYPSFHYCELLLDQGQYEDVVDRANRGLSLPHRRYPLLDEASDRLSRATALLRLSQRSGDRSLVHQAATDVEMAVERCQKAGIRYLTLHSMLVRAELSRVSGAPDRARMDLEKTVFVARRYGMRLHEIEGHLEIARLLQAEGERGKAGEHSERAKWLIEETNYHRRDRQLADIERSLAD